MGTPLLCSQDQYDPISFAGVTAVQLQFEANLGWIFRRQPEADFGIDAQVEIVTNRRPTGRLLALQIKAGESWFREESESGYVFRGNASHLEYWMGYSIPVIVVLYDPNSHRAFWADVRKHERTPKGWKLSIPSYNLVDQASAKQLTSLADPRYGRSVGIQIVAAELSGHSSTAVGSVADLRAAMFSAISEAHKSIDIEMPYISAELLWAIRIISNGTRIRLLTRVENLDSLAQLIAQLREDEGMSIRGITALHDRCVIIDGKLAILASGNLTMGGMSPEHETMTFIRQQAAVDTHRKVFDEIWSKPISLVDGKPCDAPRFSL